MISLLARLRYYQEKAALLAHVFEHAYPEKDRSLFQLLRFVAVGMKRYSPLMTQLEPSEAGSESMRPTIKGTKDEWVLHRVLLPPDSDRIHVGDVLCVSLEGQTPTASSDPVTPEASSSHSVVFRRVAAIPGDEMVSSQPSDEPFRIEGDHFWLLADNPAVPAKEAWDSRTLGPVYLESILGRAVYVVRSPTDHGPIRNSSQAMEDDAAVMAMDADMASLLQRIRGMQ